MSALLIKTVYRHIFIEVDFLFIDIHTCMCVFQLFAMCMYLYRIWFVLS